MKSVENIVYNSLPFKIIPSHNLIFVKGHGDVMFEDLVGHINEFMSHPDFCAGMNILYDMNDINSLYGDLNVLTESAELLMDEAFIPVPAKTAFLVGSNGCVKGALSGFCIMTSYSRVPHFVISDINDIVHLFSLDKAFDVNQLSVNP